MTSQMTQCRQWRRCCTTARLWASAAADSRYLEIVILSGVCEGIDCGGTRGVGAGGAYQLVGLIKA